MFLEIHISVALSAKYFFLMHTHVFLALHKCTNHLHTNLKGSEYVSLKTHAPVFLVLGIHKCMYIEEFVTFIKNIDVTFTYSCWICIYKLVVHELHVICAGNVGDSPTRTDSQMHFFFHQGTVCSQSEVSQTDSGVEFLAEISCFLKQSHDFGAFSGPTFWIEMSCKISTWINRLLLLVSPDVSNLQSYQYWASGWRSTQRKDIRRHKHARQV